MLDTSAISTLPTPLEFQTPHDTDQVEARQLSICLINPKFEPSYWGFDYALPIYPGDRRCTMITGALPALAGLVPEGHHVDILDENIEEIDLDSLDHYDIIGVTGMIVQKERMREILLALKEKPAGGAYVSVDECFFDGLCDVIFSGEAETTWPQFLSDYAAGRPYQTRYQQVERTDMSAVPKPRYDLLKANRYASGSLQFSRGCPFLYEFCDIIVTKTCPRRPAAGPIQSSTAEIRPVATGPECSLAQRQPRRQQKIPVRGTDAVAVGPDVQVPGGHVA